MTAVSFAMWNMGSYERLLWQYVLIFHIVSDRRINRDVENGQL